MKPKLKNSEPARIVDWSATRKYPPRHHAHMWYALYLLLAIGGALWQHGNWQFTLAVMAAVMPAALLSWVPYASFPLLYRHMLRGVLFLGALFWFADASIKGTPLDLGLAEGLALTSLIFLIGITPRDYGYVFFISTLLLAYSALFPRVSSLAFTIGAIAVLLLLLYRSGNRVFDAGKTAGGDDGRRYGTRLRMIIPHLLIAGGICWYVFAAIPLRGEPRSGLFAVSFITERESAMPPQLSKWMSSGQKEKMSSSADGEESTRGGSPNSLEQSGTPLPVKDLKSDDAVMGMDGGGSRGKDLVMRVKSPLKLYHLGMLYNEYDGRSWKASGRLKTSQLRGDRVEVGRLTREAELNYYVEKWVSRRLFSPYVTVYYRANGQHSRGLPLTDFSVAGGSVREKDLPELPFGYTANVLLVAPEQVTNDANRDRLQALKDELDAAGPEPEPEPNRDADGDSSEPGNRWPETFGIAGYRRLPAKLISDRVKTLAAELTAGKSAPYDKAIALRDYLRENYPYELYAKSVPDGVEATDYFLFELKTGHCEYFASALAVLARCVGLPSRVATGFSPGDYNILTGTFDVYEYHAHAWTQIYIDDYGWLTFDATPPSAVPSETTPLGIGKLRDPFGDEWRITPPELTANTLDFIGKRLAADRRRNNQRLSTLEKALAKVAEAEEKLREQAEKREKETSDDRREREKAASDDKPSLTAVVKAYVAELISECMPPVRRVLAWCGERWQLMIAGAVLLFGLGCLSVKIRSGVRILWRRYRRRKLLRQARIYRGSDPARSVRSGYAAMRLALEDAGYPRPPRMELLGYAGTLPEEAGWRSVATLVVNAFYEAEYSEKPLAPTVSAAVLQALEDGGFTAPGKVQSPRRSA